MKLLHILFFFTAGLALFGLIRPLKPQAPDAEEPVYERVMRTKTMRCGYYMYPPYIDRDLKTGKIYGTVYDLVEELGKTLGIKIEWAQEIPVGQDVAMLESGRVDAICSTADYDPMTYALIDSSEAMFYIRNGIYARQDDARFIQPVTFMDINKSQIKFTGIEGDSTLIYAKLLFPQAQTTGALPEMSEPGQAFLEINSKKADLVIVEGPVAQRVLQNNPGKYVRVEFKGHLPVYGAVFNLAKGEYRLRATLNHAINYMNINGTIDEILQRYDPSGENYIPLAKPYINAP